MRVIPTYVHGIMDYIGGVFLLLLPNIFGFDHLTGAPVWIPRVLGVVILTQAVMTNYEVGFIRTISMKTHLMNDYIAAAFLTVSPWLFGFSGLAQSIVLPFVVLGLAVLAISLMTEETPRHITTGRPATGHA